MEKVGHRAIIKTNKSRTNIEKKAEKLEVIGEGKEVTVYAIDKNKVLKVVKTYAEGGIQNTGERLKMMQGAPFVPELYEYNEHYYIQQRIKGVTLNEIDNFVTSKRFDKERFEKDTKLFIDYCKKVDWMPTDWLFKNIMIDEHADIWIVDLGRGSTREELKDFEAKQDELIELFLEKEMAVQAIRKEEIAVQAVRKEEVTNFRNKLKIFKLPSTRIDQLTKTYINAHKKNEQIISQLSEIDFIDRAIKVWLASNGYTTNEVRQLMRKGIFDTETNLNLIKKYVEKHNTIMQQKERSDKN